MMDKITVLAIESSCDETAVAIIQGSSTQQLGVNPSTLLASVVSSQINIHREFGGVVPEVASRNHSADLPHVIREACSIANISPKEIDAFAATSGPGLVAALLVGNTTGKALALASGKPFIAVNHLEGHLLSPFITEPSGPVPHLSLVVSGGHTLFVDVKGVGKYELLGRSLDDAAGEAFDKVGKMLGLPYPGGPEIDARATQGNPKAFDFPRSLLKEPGLDVSFSGLKTAVLYTLPKLVPGGDPSLLTESQMNDICASFQEAVIDTLAKKLLRAIKLTGHQTIAVSGGVSCNNGLRARLQRLAKEKGLKLILPEKRFTTDNAAMIAFAALQHARMGESYPLDQDVDPNLKLTSSLNRTKNSHKDSF
jgi:N6-L-threonylcarbamoyladenine synthase